MYSLCMVRPNPDYTRPLVPDVRPAVYLFYCTVSGNGALLEPSTTTARFTKPAPKPWVRLKTICVCPLDDGVNGCTGIGWPLMVTCRRPGLASTVGSRPDT